MENEFQEKLILELEKFGYTKYIFRDNFNGVMVKNDGIKIIDTKLDLSEIIERIYKTGIDKGVKLAKEKISKKFSYKLKIYLTELLWSL